MDATAFALAQPLILGNVTLRNRILMAPISTNYADERGYSTDKALTFYEERARGGAGALIFEALQMNPRVRIFARAHALYDDSFILGLRETVRRVHGHGVRFFAQLCHGGPKAVPSISIGETVSASASPIKLANMPRPMTPREIDETVADFGNAGARAREAGFDGVELHGAHFYLLSSFLSGHLNHRTDEYGGSVENRARLACRAIQAVKARAGEDFPVIYRYNGREALPGGIDETEAVQIARLLVGAGADALHISAGIMRFNDKVAPIYAVPYGGIPTKEATAGCFVDFAAAVKRTVQVPVIAVGKLDEPAVAERAVREGAADAVAIGRGLIADPYLPEKVLSGRWDQIARCTGCQTCHTTLQKMKFVNCEVNPKPWVPKGH